MAHYLRTAQAALRSNDHNTALAALASALTIANRERRSDLRGRILTAMNYTRSARRAAAHSYV